MPAHNALQVVVALTALAGMASNMIPKAQAADSTQATYSAETQKSLTGSPTNVYTSTNGNIHPTPPRPDLYGPPDSGEVLCDAFEHT